MWPVLIVVSSCLVFHADGTLKKRQAGDQEPLSFQPNSVNPPNSQRRFGERQRPEMPPNLRPHPMLHFEQGAQSSEQDPQRSREKSQRNKESNFIPSGGHQILREPPSVKEGQRSQLSPPGQSLLGGSHQPDLSLIQPRDPSQIFQQRGQPSGLQIQSFGSERNNGRQKPLIQGFGDSEPRPPAFTPPSSMRRQLLQRRKAKGKKQELEKGNLRGGEDSVDQQQSPSPPDQSPQQLPVVQEPKVELQQPTQQLAAPQPPPQQSSQQLQPQQAQEQQPPPQQAQQLPQEQRPPQVQVPAQQEQAPQVQQQAPQLAQAPDPQPAPQQHAPEAAQAQQQQPPQAAEQAAQLPQGQQSQAPPEQQAPQQQAPQQQAPQSSQAQQPPPPQEQGSQAQQAPQANEQAPVQAQQPSQAQQQPQQPQEQAPPQPQAPQPSQGELLPEGQHQQAPQPLASAQVQPSPPHEQPQPPPQESLDFTKVDNPPPFNAGAQSPSSLPIPAPAPPPVPLPPAPIPVPGNNAPSVQEGPSPPAPPQPPAGPVQRDEPTPGDGPESQRSLIRVEGELSPSHRRQRLLSGVNVTGSRPAADEFINSLKNLSDSQRSDPLAEQTKSIGKLVKSELDLAVNNWIMNEEVAGEIANTFGIPRGPGPQIMLLTAADVDEMHIGGNSPTSAQKFRVQLQELIWRKIEQQYRISSDLLADLSDALLGLLSGNGIVREQFSNDIAGHFVSGVERKDLWSRKRSSLQTSSPF